MADEESAPPPFRDQRSPSVFAVVLTFNAPADSLARCVAAIQHQTLAPSEILVIDNNGDHPVDGTLLAGAVPVRVSRLSENDGPAGGFAAGMEEFLRTGYDYLWAFDDDIQPDAQCLQMLLTDLAQDPEHVVVMPVALDATTGERFRDQDGWWGVLIGRPAIQTCGFPKTELFFGLEDQEYFIDRLPLAGFPLARSESAIVRARVRDEFEIAPWKFYYFSRNLVYQYLYDRRHMRFLTRVKSLVNQLARWWRNALDSKSQRPQKLSYFARGLIDGALGRLGKRVDPDRADRPRVI